MPEVKKQNIYIKIAELEPIPLQIKPENEATYRYAERLVNELWFKWMQMFENKCTSEEVMARVAFQFARLYAEARKQNAEVETLLSEFEKKLDDMVIKV